MQVIGDSTGTRVATAAGKIAVVYVWRRVWFTIAVAACGVTTLRFAWRRFRLFRNRRTQRMIGEAAAADCRRVREELSEEEWTEEDEELLQLDVEELLERLRGNKIAAARVVRAFLKKALDCSAQRNMNCVTQPVIGALEHAAHCDALLESGQRAALLQGLPVSIKECMNITGMRSHWGVVSECSQPVTDDCVIVKVLKSHGAVPFVKTNVPQTMLSFDSSNPAYGVTLNPHDPSRGPGGSSSGEAALMALGGSLLGLGTDIAGSTRIPAAFCGIVGFKPTMGRISAKGLGTPLPGVVGIGKTPGPQSQTVAGCRLLMEALCSDLMWRLDSTIPPVRFVPERCLQVRTLRVGYYEEDGFFPATPAYRRAVHEARAMLEARGHELVPFKPPRIHDAIKLYYGLVGGDGFETVKRMLKCDVTDVSVRHLVSAASHPRWLMGVLRPVIGMLWPRTSHAMCQSRRRRVDELWSLITQRKAYINEFTDAWQQLRLDGVICPPHAMGPPPLGKCASMTCSFSYTMLFNLLDYPAGVVPVTKVTTVDELALRDHPRGNYWDRLVADYSVGTSGLPVGVQCATLPWQDETCLYLMRELELAVSAKAKTAGGAATA